MGKKIINKTQVIWNKLNIKKVVKTTAFFMSIMLLVFMFISPVTAAPGEDGDDYSITLSVPDNDDSTSLSSTLQMLLL